MSLSYKSTCKAKIETNYSKVPQLIANFDKNVEPVSPEILEKQPNDCNEMGFWTHPTELGPMSMPLND